MQSQSKISYIIISVIVLGFLGTGLYFYNKMFKGIKDPLTVVPDHVAVIVEIPDFKKFTEDWEKGSAYEKAILEWPFFKDVSQWLPDILIGLHKSTHHFEDWAGSKLIISFHSDGYLILFPSGGLGLADFRTEMLAVLKGKLKVEEKTINNEYYLKAQIDNREFLISEKRGLFIISNSLDLIENSLINTSSPNQISKAENFQALQKVSGKRSDAHVFINYQYLDSLSTGLLHDLPPPIWSQTGKIANWTGLDLNLKPNELLLNGYTILPDTGFAFLELFRDQKSVGMLLPDNFPYETESYLHISISNYETYFQAWKKYLNSTNQWKKYQGAFNKIAKNLPKNSSISGNDWWSGEMASLSIANGKEYAVFLAEKGRDSFKSLSEIAHLSQPSMITSDYKTHKIKEINFPDYLFTQFGPWFQKSQKCYFVVVDELVIFAQTIDDLRDYIDDLEEGNILLKNESYLEFSDNLSKNTNYSFYIKRPDAKARLFQMFPKDIKTELDKMPLFQKNLSGFSLQMSWKNQMIYTGVFANISANNTKSDSQWQVNLDSEIVAGPFAVTDHTDGSHKYIVFDDFRQMYLINEQGDIVWKKQLEEKVMGTVYEMDYYNNGKIQYLFNTENYLYLIDLTGQMVSGYPVQLNSKATASVSLIDYNSNKDYRIFIPTENGEVYNYNKDGSLLKDWKAKNTRRKIVKPITHVVANSNDYLIAEADNGNILMYNRKGDVRLEIRKSFVNALGSDIYTNRTNSKGMMVTTDEKGKFVYIPEKGDVQTTDFGNFSKEHFFLYTDFTANGSEDFIYLDGNSLTVFDKFKNTLFSYVFEHDITNKPKLFNISGRKYLGIIDTEEGQLYLFDSDGLVSKKFKGNTDFIIESKKGKNPVVLIGKGKSLMKYPL